MGAAPYNSTMSRPGSRLLGPIFRLWSPFFLLQAGLAASSLPKPTDAPKTHVPGPDPDRILVVGGGIAVGFGVLSHELGIVGHLSRMVSAVTGRGVESDIIAEADFRIHEVADQLREVNLASYDAVVLFLGVTDSIRHTSARSWNRSLTSVLEDFGDRLAAGAQVFVVGIQPVRQVTTVNYGVGAAAERHSHLLERESVRVCANIPHASYVLFQPKLEHSDRYRTSAMYQKWAALVAPQVAEALQRSHPMGDFSI